MADNKTRKTSASVAEFLERIDDPERRADCEYIAKVMRAATGNRAAMWGDSIIGFGQYTYRYASGRSGEWPIVGFSPRKQDLTIYIMPGFAGRERLLARIGKHRTGRSCLYLKRLADVDVAALEELIKGSVAEMRAKYG